MEKLITFILAAILIAAVWAGVMWGLWSLWRWVLPQVWVAGPQNILAPGFWLFAACWTLTAMVGRAIFGGSSK